MEWTIKQTADVTGISADTLRYYESQINEFIGKIYDDIRGGN